MADRPQVTPEQVLGTVEYKAVERAIKQEFPWVKRIVLDDSENINKYGIVFFNLVVDPFKLRDYLGLEFRPWVLKNLKKGEKQREAYLSTLFSDTDYETHERTIRGKIEAIINQVRLTPVIPSHLKLPPKRNLGHHAYIIPADSTIPADYKVDENELWQRLMNIRNTN